MIVVIDKRAGQIGRPMWAADDIHILKIIIPSRMERVRMSEITGAHHIEIMVEKNEIALVLANDIILETIVQVKTVFLYDVVTTEPPIGPY